MVTVYLDSTGETQTVALGVDCPNGQCLGAGYAGVERRGRKSVASRHCPLIGHLWSERGMARVPGNTSSLQSLLIWFLYNPCWRAELT